jgi:hypothetical protein
MLAPDQIRWVGLFLVGRPGEACPGVGRGPGPKFSVAPHDETTWIPASAGMTHSKFVAPAKPAPA